MVWFVVSAAWVGGHAAWVGRHAAWVGRHAHWVGRHAHWEGRHAHWEGRHTASTGLRHTAGVVVFSGHTWEGHTCGIGHAAGVVLEHAGWVGFTGVAFEIAHFWAGDADEGFVAWMIVVGFASSMWVVRPTA